MSLHPLHRIWRALPAGARRAAFFRGAVLFAPRPDLPPPPVRHGIVVGGEISRASGLGEGARLMHAALEKLGVPAWKISCEVAVPGEASAAARAALPPDGAALVVHVNAPVLAAAFLGLPRGFLRGRRVIGYWAWELPVVPDSWLTGARFVHEIWTPSKFSASALERLAPGRVRVVPHPVAAAPPVAAALTRADFGLRDDAVVVLVSFSLASSFERKNPLAAIAAFKAAFGDRTDRVLVLKILHAGHAPGDLEVLRQHVGEARNIMFETRILPIADSHALTRCADIVLSLHRSEGFGLVPAEAALLGRAVVATDFSGTTDFLDASCSIPVPYRLVAARDPRGVFEAPGATWAEADVGAAADALRGLADDAGLRARLGAAAQIQVAHKLGAEALRDAVRSLGWRDGG
jgi:glycosyltransferase involved in cell wall biosynthesis